MRDDPGVVEILHRAWQSGTRSARRRRAVLLAAALAVSVLGYGAVFYLTYEDATTAELNYGAPPPTDGASQLGVYATVLSIDPVNQALHLRVHLTPSRALRGDRANMVGRNITLHFDDGYSPHEEALRVNEAIAPLNLEASLAGSSAASYPFERLNMPVRVRAADDADPAAVVPVRLTIWEGIAGWSLHAIEEPGGAGEVRLRLALRRTGAIKFLVLSLYFLMAMIAAAALAIGCLVFLRIRRMEMTMAGALSGMLFALPAMRYGLPGSPPLGVLADHLVFMWAELAVAMGLLLTVLAWAIDGKRE
jgi:hypothetical protein